MGVLCFLSGRPTPPCAPLGTVRSVRMNYGAWNEVLTCFPSLAPSLGCCWADTCCECPHPSPAPRLSSLGLTCQTFRIQNPGLFWSPRLCHFQMDYEAALGPIYLVIGLSHGVTKQF